MEAIGVIPARLGSTRLEGKVLLSIAGKPMLQHVWERSKESKYLSDVIVACDDERIKTLVESFGAKAVMTSKEHPSGTDRIAEAVQHLDVDIVVNIQGDEPLIQHSVIDGLVKSLSEDQSYPVATAIKYIDQLSDFHNPNVVKVVIDDDMGALYFSRSAIPFNGEQKEPFGYKHLGIYAYRKDFLLEIKDWKKSKLEIIEKLEQLRILQAGYKIKTVLTEVETVGVDTQEDLDKVEHILQQG